MSLRHFMYPNKLPVCFQAAHKIPINKFEIHFHFILLEISPRQSRFG